MADEKKFTDEVMNEDYLDEVAGGKTSEIADDSRFLNSLNGSCGRYGATKILFGGTHGIEQAWAKVGIEAELQNSLLGKNKYYLNGKEITQEEARQHAMKVTGHHMERKDWKW